MTTTMTTSPASAEVLQRRQVTIARRKHPAFDAIVTEAERLQWPKHYRDDLYQIDRESIASHAADGEHKFIWGIRATGTDLYYLAPDYRPWLAASVNQRTNQFYYFWDGQSLAEVTPENALAILDHAIIACVKRLRRQGTNEAERIAYFERGALVSSYGGGQDRVERYQPTTTKTGWFVIVHAVDRYGQKIGPTRSHCTDPATYIIDKIRAITNNNAL